MKENSAEGRVNLYMDKTMQLQVQNVTYRINAGFVEYAESFEFQTREWCKCIILRKRGSGLLYSYGHINQLIGKMSKFYQVLILGT